METSIVGGRYKIIKALGRGAFGQTYLAEDMENQQKCVVKYLQPQFNDEATLDVAKRLFNLEAEALALLGDHPQIPKLFAYYKDDFCLVQEFIQGDDLRKEIAKGKQLTDTQVISILRDVLHILTYIHGKNVIHRDLKPSNLIRRITDDKLVLIDFGAVKEISSLQTNNQGQTIVTVAVGTPGFMPSEQQGGKPRFSSDLYALGMMLIQALTGESPTELLEDQRTGKEILNQDTKVNKKLAAIIDKMVRVDWRDRYQSAQEVLRDLDSPFPWLLPKLSTGVKIAIPVTIIITSIFVIPFVRSIYLLNQANKLVDTKEYTQAIPIYDQVLKIYPNSAKTWYLKAFALSQLNRIEQQLAACDQAIKIDPEFVSALNCRGLALHYLGRYSEAITAYDQIIKVQPDFYQAYNNKGESLLKLGRPQEALEAFDQSVLYNSDYIFAWNNRGNVLFQLGRYAEALAAYSKAIELDPKYSYGWLGRGNAQRLLGRYQLAIDDYNQAIQIDPKFYEAFYSRGLAQLELKEYEPALASFDQAIQIKPDYLSAIEKREKVFQALKR